MTKRTVSVQRFGAFLAAVAGVLLLTSWLAAKATPGKEDRLVTEMVCTFLQRAHVAKPEIGDELSRRLFHRFFKDLDPSKLYFMKSDLDEFMQFETELDDMLLKNDLSFAYKVYDRFVARTEERQKLIQELVKGAHDFTVKESISTDFDKLDFAKDESELRERWRKRIKFDLLLQKLDKKPLPEAEAKQKIISRYQNLLKRWKQLDNYDLMELYLSALTTSVDPHSNYMSPNTLADFEIAMRLQLEGIGALLRSENGQTIIAEVIPGGAAAKDGRLKANDKIVGVAQGDSKFTDVVDMKLTEVVKMIRGSRGTKVQLRVIPADKVEPLVYDLTRQKIELKAQEARAEIIEQGKKADGKPYRVGVIDLPSFYLDMEAARSRQSGYKSATEDVRKILRQFTDEGVDGVILDLRHNGGGALIEAQALTGLFIDEGPVVQVKDSAGKVKQKDDPEKGTAYSGPLMVLTSRLSASASEILAGALQDYGRALVVGDTTTHGKGTVQEVVDLGGRLPVDDPPRIGALKLTIQQFYRVNGDSTQNKGVVSDIVLPSLTEHLATGEKDLEHALAFDRVSPVEHEEMGMIPADLKTVIQKRSTERVKASKEFTKLAREIEQVKIRKERKSVTLNEKELREQFAKDDADKIESKVDGDLGEVKPKDPSAPYKFKRDYYGSEVLRIMEDFLQGKKLTAAK